MTDDPEVAEAVGRSFYRCVYVDDYYNSADMDIHEFLRELRDLGYRVVRND